jgi:pimeloyl-ACP methyl ester carboxylesterase
LGIYYVAVNYRGCDGYGLDYAQLRDTSAAVRDILGILNEVSRDERVDASNVFLYSQSDGGALIYELLAKEPGRWRGAMLDHPPTTSPDPRWRAQKLPPLMIISGDQDRFLPALVRVAAWARTNQIPVNLIVQTNCGHLNWKTAETREVARQMVKFCFVNQR